MLDIGYSFHQRLLIFDHLTLELLQMLIDAIEPSVHLCQHFSCLLQFPDRLQHHSLSELRLC